MFDLSQSKRGWPFCQGGSDGTGSSGFPGSLERDPVGWPGVEPSSLGAPGGRIFSRSVESPGPSSGGLPGGSPLVEAP